MDLDEFVQANAPEEGAKRFELENEKLLDIDLDGTAMMKAGSMIAYTGNVSFTGKSSAEGGISGFLKEKVTNEGTPVMEAEGTGHVYVADQGKKIQLLHLDAGEKISVNGNDILAFESQVDYSIGTVSSISAASSGGLTNVFLEGPGSVAITTHGDPLVLTPPVKTDPDATVAWSGSLSPGASRNTNLGDMIGQSSDERYQLDFSGDEGFVIVQPYEESQPQQ
ncbi:AIM24 family protein [Halosolutus halophilus]|uniref:AIM24 family protein n=1 Tax=Halosolutus halophilus TaxID=1552990 RepID=UPI002234F9B8|nr:AIM24 family protein [Halosolutus halophilus]